MASHTRTTAPGHTTSVEGSGATISRNAWMVFGLAAGATVLGVPAIMALTGCTVEAALVGGMAFGAGVGAWPVLFAAWARRQERQLAPVRAEAVIIRRR